MPRDDFRRDLNDAFSRISGSPSGDLQARVRTALVDAPERRGPTWLAGVAAVAIAALIVVALFVVGPLRSRQPVVPGGTVTPSPTSTLPAFACGESYSSTGTTVETPTAFVDAVRGGVNSGYDRFVIQFQSGQPQSVEITLQDKATFPQGASGQPVQLQGSDGMLITIHGADGHTQYTGPTDLHIGRGVLEARQVQDFEGVVQWALGLSKPACYRAFWLTGPNRLVIDVQTS
jgi:hypothetical protein